MGVHRRITALLFIVLLAVEATTPLLSLLPPAAKASTDVVKLPRVVLIKLWSVDHITYMAKFIGEDYIAVFTCHGDVSLDGKYIGVVAVCSGPGRDAVYIYKVSTGELVAKLVADSDDVWGDTWKIESWEPFRAVKVWDRFGFFSADSKRMIEDVRAGGTAARVVDTTTWTTIPIDWGFTDTNGLHFYAVQLDYSGSTLAVGYIYTGKLLVYKYEPEQNKYVKVFEHQEYGNYGRRLQMTLDGKYILVGGINYDYLDIWEWNGTTYTRVVHYKLPDAGGIGALGISNPWKVEYIVAGTKNGWVIIAYFNVTTKEFKVIYQAKEAPDDSWLYNPFYERWIPKVTEVFAFCSHRDSRRPGYGIVYDLLTNQTVVIHFADAGTVRWSAAAVSPQANYVFLGNTLYMVVKRDVQAKKPRLRMWGTLYYRNEEQDLGSPLVLEAPSKEWHLYFFSGKLTIRELHIEPVPVELIEDEDILAGKLSKMAKKHKRLVDIRELHAVDAKVVKYNLMPGEEISESLKSAGVAPVENFVASAAVVRFTPPLGDYGHAWLATSIRIPIDKPVSIYDDITFQASMTAVTAALVYDQNKDIYGVYALSTNLGQGAGVDTRALSKVAMYVLADYLAEEKIKQVIKEIGTKYLMERIPSPIAYYVGIAYVTLSELVESLRHGAGDASIQQIVVVAPLIQDKYGNLYTAVKLVVPENADASTYTDIIRNYFLLRGYTDVGISIERLGPTWESYETALSRGFVVKPKLDELINSIAVKYGLSLDELKITGVEIILITHVMAKRTLFQYLFSQSAELAFLTLIGAKSIQIRAKLKAGTIKDPARIATLLGKVVINGKEFELTPGKNGAYVEFGSNLGTGKLVISFKKRRGYYADIEINAKVLVKTELQPLEDYGYMAKLHYDWEDTKIRVERVEFADVPYPMKRVERVAMYKNIKLTDDVTSAFSLSQVVDDEDSPTGKFYYYIVAENDIKALRLVDPVEANVLEPCKTLIFYYYYAEPPDAGVIVKLDATNVTSTLPHYATVIVNSNKPQKVVVNITFAVKYHENERVETAIANYIVAEFDVPPNGTATEVYDITSYVDAAINIMEMQNKTSFVEINATIIGAEYNAKKTNDQSVVVYYPPPILPAPLPRPEPGIPIPNNFTVTVTVLDAANLTPVAGATVIAAFGENATEAVIKYKAVTNETGMVTLILAPGIWTFIASAPGYNSTSMTVPVYNDTNITLYLVPSEAQNYVPPSPTINETKTPIIIPVMVNGTKENVSFFWLGVQVLWANGLPFEGANVTVYNDTGVVASRTTDSTGMAWFLLPGFKTYTVAVTAINPYNTSLVYTATRTVVLESHLLLSFNTTWLPGVPELAKKYRLIVHAYDVITGEPVVNATIVVLKGDIGYINKTNTTGMAEFVLPFLGKWEVVGLHPNYTAVNQTVEIFENLTLVNLPFVPKNASMPVLPPVNGTYPPVVYEGKEYYWLSVQVLWKDGYPFQGADVLVYNLTDGSLLFQQNTNGTGFAHFLIPANATIKLVVEAVHPEDPTLIFHEEKTLNMTQHYYFVFKVPWKSRYWQPEVILKEVKLLVHTGLAYYFGNMSHLALLYIWTNVPQSIKVLVGLYNVTGESWVENETITTDVTEGLNRVYAWVSTNTSGLYRVFANITEWEYDTNVNNNYAWSNTVYLRPMVDIQAFVLWRPIKQKLPWALLPGDIIEIDIGIKLPANTSSIPAKLAWRIEQFNLKKMEYETAKGAEEEVRVVKPGIAWRNVTLTVPWTSKIVVLVNVTHEWEDAGYNNYANVTIEVDPDVRIEIVKAPTVVTEGSKFKVVVNITSNVEPGKGSGWLSIVDNSTATLLKLVDVELAPEKTVELEVTAPTNPTQFGFIRAPATAHKMTVSYAGYDMYTDDNEKTFTVTVVSYQWLILLVLFAALVAALATLKALAHTIHEVREARRRFVKRKPRFIRRHKA